MTTDQNVSGSNELEPVRPTELVLPPDAGMALLADRLVEQAHTDGSR